MHVDMHSNHARTFSAPPRGHGAAALHCRLVCTRCVNCCEEESRFQRRSSVGGRFSLYSIVSQRHQELALPLQRSPQTTSWKTMLSHQLSDVSRHWQSSYFSFFIKLPLSSPLLLHIRIVFCFTMCIHIYLK